MKLFKKKQQKQVELPKKVDVLESEEKSIWEEEELLELDYITTIYDILQSLKKQHEECAMDTSQVAVKMDCNEKDIQSAIVNLEDIGKSFLGYIEKLNDMILENKTFNKDIIQTMDGLINSVEMLRINIDKNNRRLIKELEEFCMIANRSKANINKIESLTKQMELSKRNIRVQLPIGDEDKNENGFRFVGDEIEKLSYQSEQCTNELTKNIESINEIVLNSEQLLKDTSSRLTNEREILKDITDIIKTTIIKNTNKSINTYQMIDKEISGTISRFDIVNKELVRIANLIMDETDSISNMCKKQVEQEVNIYRILELSQQLKDIKSN